MLSRLLAGKRLSFWTDRRLHGFAAAWRKRFGQFQVGGQAVKFSQLCQADPGTQVELCHRALAVRQWMEASWVFRAMVLSQGQLAPAWSAYCRGLERIDNDFAIDALKVVLVLDEEPSLIADVVGDDPRTCFLLGVIHLNEARSQPWNQWHLESHKQIAMTYLETARKPVEQRAGSDPYRANAAAAAGIAAQAAAAYETAMYLKYEPPVLQLPKKGKGKGKGKGGIGGAGTGSSAGE